MVSVGSGPLDWFIALDPRVKELILIDAHPLVAHILSCLHCTTEEIPISEMEPVCRNAPNLPNTDLSDRAHLEMGLARLEQALIPPRRPNLGHFKTIIEPLTAASGTAFLLPVPLFFHKFTHMTIFPLFCIVQALCIPL